MTREIGIGVIGLGVMGRTHIGAYNAASRAGLACRLVAVCDRAPDRLGDAGAARGNIDTGVGAERLFDPARVRRVTDPGELLADPAVELVSICTHTDTHAPLAIRALEAGKHVLVEKPVALDSATVRRVADAARAARTLCLPAMCMRFWPTWAWLRERVRDRSLGAVTSAVFQRLATPPGWSSEFYRDPAKSGGALIDLHIHDADFVRWCFGSPESIVTIGSIDHLTTIYRYPKGRGPGHVVAEGGWNHTPGFGFRMRYVVVFEGATAEFDIGRDPMLLLSREGKCEPVPLEPLGLYEGEIRHVLAAIGAGRRDLGATMDEAVEVARLLECERRSLEGGGAPVNVA